MKQSLNTSALVTADSPKGQRASQRPLRADLVYSPRLYHSLRMKESQGRFSQVLLNTVMRALFCQGPSYVKSYNRLNVKELCYFPGFLKKTGSNQCHRTGRQTCSRVAVRCQPEMVSGAN